MTLSPTTLPFMNHPTSAETVPVVRGTILKFDRNTIQLLETQQGYIYRAKLVFILFLVGYSRNNRFVINVLNKFTFKVVNSTLIYKLLYEQMQCQIEFDSTNVLGYKLIVFYLVCDWLPGSNDGTFKRIQQKVVCNCFICYKTCFFTMFFMKNSPLSTLSFWTQLQKYYQVLTSYVCVVNYYWLTYELTYSLYYIDVNSYQLLTALN